MKICISGLTGSGKSTLSKRLAEHYGVPLLSGGDMLKKLIAGDEAMADPGWWEREVGRAAMEIRRRDPGFDKRVDEELIKAALRLRDVVLDSWTMPYLLEAEDKVAIFLKADLKVRAKRVALRDGLPVEVAEERIRRKDSETAEIYEKLYGFRLGEDLRPFHLVLDTSRLNRDQVFSIVRRFVDWWFGR